MQTTLAVNPFATPRVWRKAIINSVKLTPVIRFNGKGFICVLINSLCPIGCEHCMFFSNMAERKNAENTMTRARLEKLMKLVSDSNTGYLLVSGGGEGFLEPDLMYEVVQETKAEVTWMVTSAYWAKNLEKAREVVRRMHDAYLRGKHKENSRTICLRVSLDTQHVEKISPDDKERLQYIINLIRIFETDYAHEKGFELMIHSLHGQEPLVAELVQAVSGEEIPRHNPLHEKVKVTESAFVVRLPSGYEFEVTFAKLLLSDLAADLRDKETLKKRIEIFDRDAFRNERGQPAIKYNIDGKFGPNMLVIYNGRVSGGWQSEMPDVPMNLDSDSFDDIMRKTLSDPGVLGTVEKGLHYRFDIIQEVCPRAVLRSKAVNIRDYTSLVLLEEDKVKLYYSIRVLQDFLAEGRIDREELKRWPEEIRFMVSMSDSDLQALYRDAKYDIVQQFVEFDNRFGKFVECLKRYAQNGNLELLSRFLDMNPDIDARTIDRWRLLLRRITNDWYDQHTFDDAELVGLRQAEVFLSHRLLDGKVAFEGLSLP